MNHQVDHPRGGAMRSAVPRSHTAGKALSWGRLLLALALAMALTPAANGETVGLFTFDTMADTRDAPDGERVFDATDAELHLTRQHAAGSAWLSTDLPSLAPAGSMAFQLRDALAVDTPETDLYSIGRQGELSVEFWYRPGETGAQERDIVAQAAGPNSWRMYNFGTSIHFAATDANGVTHTLQADNVLGNQWTHLAVTVDNAGQARLYQDGTPIATGNGFTGFQPYASTLRVGAANVNPPSDPDAGQFQIDDLRISDTALAPGSGTGQNELAWNNSFSSPPNPGTAPDEPGKTWVRNNPFMLNAYGFHEDTDTDLYIEVGLNTVLANDNTFHRAAEAGLATHWMGQNIRSYPTLDDKGRTDVHTASHAPGMTAYMIRDEPSRHTSPTGGMEDITRPVADYVRSIDAQRMVYVNAYPNLAVPAQRWGNDSNPDYSYEQYIDDLMTIVQPDVLSYDHYPFRHSPGFFNYDLYWENLTLIRDKAKQYNVPFMAWLQSFEDTHHRLPSDSELRFQAYTHMAAGAKGFSYFVFEPNVESWTGLLNYDGTPSSMYTHTAATNGEIARLGQSLRMLESTALHHVPGESEGDTNDAPSGLTNWTAGTGNDNLLKSVEVVGEGADRNGLIGVFIDDEDDIYFMLVNLRQGPGLTAEQTQLSFVLEFDDSVESIWRLNRETGEAQELPLLGNKLHLTLPGGTGDLFNYDGNFAIPEPATLGVLMLGGAAMMMRRDR
ncbi:MAG: LamG-like jellyroll fold domain-containing protein [Phycisphaeraceae bacterium]